MCSIGGCGHSSPRPNRPVKLVRISGICFGLETERHPARTGLQRVCSGPSRNGHKKRPQLSAPRPRDHLEPGRPSVPPANSYRCDLGAKRSRRCYENRLGAGHARCLSRLPMTRCARPRPMTGRELALGHNRRWIHAALPIPHVHGKTSGFEPPGGVDAGRLEPPGGFATPEGPNPKVSGPSRIFRSMGSDLPKSCPD